MIASSIHSPEKPDIPTDSSETKFIQNFAMKNEELDLPSSQEEEKKGAANVSASDSSAILFIPDMSNQQVEC